MHLSLKAPAMQAFFICLNQNKFSELLFVFLLTTREQMFIIQIYQIEQTFKPQNKAVIIESWCEL